MKFELIRYVVKEERLCGTTLNEDGLHFASQLHWERAMVNLAVGEVVGGVVTCEMNL